MDIYEEPAKYLRRLFRGMVEQVFQGELGVADSELTDYVSEMLMRLERTEALFRARCVRGKRLDYVSDMLIEANAREGVARREAYHHLGDTVLFLLGYCSVSGEVSQALGRKEETINYREIGPKVYLAAGRLYENDPLGALLGKMSERFELCAYGLGQVRRELEMNH